MNGILVTGGAGFIGSHTSICLLQKGYKLFILDSFVNSSIESIKRVSLLTNNIDLPSNENLQIYKGDVRDSCLLKKIFDDSISLNSRISAVIHFAGLKSVNESFVKSLQYWDVNVAGSINLLKIMQNYNCYTLVFSSSASIYGCENKIPFKENSKINPINPYANTKYMVEKFLDNLFESNKTEWRIASLRYFNPIGAHSSGMIGENPKGLPDNIFPRILDVSLGIQKELKIFGKNWPTYDGTCVRDYIHIMDLAQAHIRTLEYLSSEKPQIINLNIGTGKGTSVLSLINEFQQANKLNIVFSYSNKREGDSPVSIADNSLCKEILNWVPSKTLKEMCRDGFNWRKKNPNGYK